LPSFAFWAGTVTLTGTGLLLFNGTGASAAGGAVLIGGSASVAGTITGGGILTLSSLLVNSPLGLTVFGGPQVTIATVGRPVSIITPGAFICESGSLIAAGARFSGSGTLELRAGSTVLGPSLNQINPSTIGT
jgi:hypothetical protein